MLNPTPSRGRGRESLGFTLIELVVTVLIIGILAAFAVPQYLRTVETSKADDAVALVNIVGTTNRMYALDHNNTFTDGVITNACNTRDTATNICCPGSAGCGAGLALPCNLVQCGYLAAADFDGKPYVVLASNAAGVSATTRRRLSSDPHPSGNYSDTAPYASWGYSMSASGAITKATSDTPEPTH